MRFLRQSLTGLFLLAVTAGLLLFAGNLVRGALEERLARDNSGPPARERVFSVNVVEAEAGRIAPELVAFGEVQSRRSLEVRASAPGAIIQLSENFEDGARVNAGEVLVQVDPSKARFALDRLANDLLDAEAEDRDAVRTLKLAQDELASAEAQLALRQKAFDRQVDLQSRGVGTAAAVETAELALSSARQAVLSNRRSVAQGEARIDQAETRLERTRIALAEAERDLDDTIIRADFAGTLSEVNAVEGGLVSMNERLATLIDPLSLEVAFRVSTPQYVRLLDEDDRLHQSEVTVSLDVMGTDLQATGVITRDAAAVGEGQTGRVLYARLDGARGLKPGDFVTVRVQEPELERVVRLPATALDAAGTVLVVGEEDRLDTLNVTLLRRQGDSVLVRGRGLTGQRVVTRRTPLLGAGIKVKPIGPAGEIPEAPAMVALSDEERQRFVTAIEANDRIPGDVKKRMLNALSQPEVPAQMVERLRARMGG
ncbi:HlyD family secretion protein [Shimia isoporae]|uniref:HlyD family secretion protein n=1 Tax=Shimia isoporae TaxID=647720 RepID=A0A4R1N0E5_9RHOB|nr:HlyD family efflux transporter periplasmic adaptor subunit [Shimia isoporae]TCK99327.1 HlyD family secretion protein [Shimia isoporae]